MMREKRLFFRKMGEGQPVIVLHGLFGSSDNWLSMGKLLAENFTVYLLDQRNHGQSFHDNEHSFAAMAEDLANFIEQNGIDRPHIMGHSMGGKVAMKFALDRTNELAKLIVVDISPRGYRVHHQRILQGLKAVPLSLLESRKQADDILTEYVPETSERQFLLKNLTRNEKGFEWRINLPVLDSAIEKIVAEVSGAPVGNPTLFIKGETSEYIRDIDLPIIGELFPNSTVTTIKNAGHWIHAEQPELFLQTVRLFLL